MGTRGFIQRFLPFVAAFAVGIFVASFFVQISGPRFSGGKKTRVIRELRAENERLRLENLRLRNEVNSLRPEEAIGPIEETSSSSGHSCNR